MNITATIDDKEVRAALARAAASISNMRPVMQRIGAAYDHSVRENFRHESSPDGQKWAPNHYNKKRKNPKILVFRGDLLSHIHFQVVGNSVAIGTGPEKYAAIHQFGGSITREERDHDLHFKMDKKGVVGNRFVKKGKSNFTKTVKIGGHTITIPARPYLAVNRGDTMALAPKDSTMVVDIINKYIASVIK
jgi:phage virion morphogenesis protein